MIAQRKAIRAHRRHQRFEFLNSGLTRTPPHGQHAAHQKKPAPGSRPDAGCIDQDDADYGANSTTTR